MITRLRRKPKGPDDPEALKGIIRRLERENYYLRQENSSLKREVGKLENLQRSTVDMIQRDARRREWDAIQRERGNGRSIE